MSMHTPHGPQNSGDTLGDLVALSGALWRFVTTNPLGILLALAVIAYLLFSLSLFAIPRATLYMAQSHQGEGDDEKRKEDRDDKACFALVVEAQEKCLDDPTLPQAGGDLAGSVETEEPTPRPIFFVIGSDVDGYVESYYDLNVKVWQAMANAPENDAARRESRHCVTQMITDRWGDKNTFVAFSGHLAGRNALKSQIGWYVMPIVRLDAPDHAIDLAGMSFAPLRPAQVDETCGH